MSVRPGVRGELWATGQTLAQRKTCKRWATLAALMHEEWTTRGEDAAGRGNARPGIAGGCTAETARPAAASGRLGDAAARMQARHGSEGIQSVGAMCRCGGRADAVSTGPAWEMQKRAAETWSKHVENTQRDGGDGRVAMCVVAAERRRGRPIYPRDRAACATTTGRSSTLSFRFFTGRSHCGGTAGAGAARHARRRCCDARRDLSFSTTRARAPRQQHGGRAGRAAPGEAGAAALDARALPQGA